MTETLTSPAWVDVHAHLRGFSARGGIDPVQYGSTQGVGVIADAGSAPAASLPSLLAEQPDGSPRVVAWANICAEGISGKDCTSHDISGAAADVALRDCPGRVVGIKLQASNTRLAHRAIEALHNARSVAERHSVPLLVHVGNAPPALNDVLAELRPGDIVTHFAHGKPGGMVEDGRVIVGALEARRRGVLFDIGHGAGSFSFEVMEQLIGLDFPPDVISTDLHAGSAESPVGSLADCMSKLIGLGVPLAAVIEAVTATPLRALQMESLGATEFVVQTGTWTARDSYGNERDFASRIIPRPVKVTA